MNLARVRHNDASNGYRPKVVHFNKRNSIRMKFDCSLKTSDVSEIFLESSTFYSYQIFYVTLHVDCVFLREDWDTFQSSTCGVVDFLPTYQMIAKTVIGHPGFSVAFYSACSTSTYVRHAGWRANVLCYRCFNKIKISNWTL